MAKCKRLTALHFKGLINPEHVVKLKVGYWHFLENNRDVMKPRKIHIRQMRIS